MTKHLEIPYGTTEIAPFEYSCNQEIVSVHIPDTVASIGMHAFNACQKLTEIVLPDSVISIGEEAFSACTALQRIVLPSRLREIPPHMCFNCFSLAEIEIPDSVVFIGNGAFEDCFQLERVSLPRNVEVIGDAAFCECSALRELLIPSSVKIVGDGVVGGCRLEKLIVESDGYFFDDYCIYEKGKDRLVSCYNTDICRYPIPSTIKAIGGHAFSSCQRISRMIIPDGVEEIGNSTFFSCKSLRRVVLPDSVKRIGRSAFLGCGKLRHINLPQQLAEIGTMAFCYTGLRSVEVPDGVQKIGYMAFEGCKHLAQVIVNGNPEIDPEAFLNCPRLKNRYTMSIIFPIIQQPKELKPLIDFVSGRWSLGRTHGIAHWERVARNGILLSLEAKGNGHYALREDVNIKVVLLFAYLHDSCRENDCVDDDHGPRAEQLMLQLRDTILRDLTDEEAHLLGTACRLHTLADRTGDATIDVCFDADRLDLGRVYVTPRPEKMATEKGAYFASHPEEWHRIVHEYESFTGHHCEPLIWD